MKYLLRLPSVTIAFLFICLPVNPVHGQALGSEAWNRRQQELQKIQQDRSDRLIKREFGLSSSR